MGSCHLCPLFWGRTTLLEPKTGINKIKEVSQLGTNDARSWTLPASLFNSKGDCSKFLVPKFFSWHTVGTALQPPETLCFRLVSLWEWVCPVAFWLFYNSKQEAGWVHREQQCQAKLLSQTTLLSAEPVFPSGTFPRITLNPSTPGTMTPTDPRTKKSLDFRTLSKN